MENPRRLKKKYCEKRKDANIKRNQGSRNKGPRAWPLNPELESKMMAERKGNRKLIPTKKTGQEKRMGKGARRKRSGNKKGKRPERRAKTVQKPAGTRPGMEKSSPKEKRHGEKKRSERLT